MNNKVLEAQSAYDKGDFKKAASLYQECLAENSLDTSSRLKLAASLIQLGELKSSLEIIQEILNVEPDLAEALYLISYVYLLQKHYEESETYSRRAIKSAPDYAKAFELLGTILLYKNDVTSIHNLQKAVELDKNNWSAHLMLGQAYNKFDQSRNAYEEYKIAYKLNPSPRTRYFLLNQIGYHYRIWIGFALALLWILAFIASNIWLVVLLCVLFFSSGVVDIFMGEKKRGLIIIGIGLFTLLAFFFIRN
jgi:tetratricopeptide (TPR) repeat protein